MNKYIAYLNVIVICLISAFALSCKDDTDSQLGQFSIQADTISSEFATMSWDTPSGDNGPISYYVYLNGDLVYGEYTQNEYTFTELSWDTKYTVTVVAEDAGGAKVEANLEFQTIGNLPPAGLAITDIQFPTIHHVDVYYTKAADPEGDIVSYEIYVDGQRQPRSEEERNTSNENYFYLWDLYHSTEYTVKLVAKDKQGKESFVEKTFETPVPGPVFRGNLTLETQYEVDIFPYTDIKGWLSIVGPDITDLSPLSKLVNVNKKITIEGTSVTSLDGLENVTIIPVNDNGNLAVQAELQILDNPNLVSLGNLSKLSSLGWLDIINNDQLRDLDGLSALTEFTGTFQMRYATHLGIADNDNLENIDGLTNVRIFRNTSIGIQDNPSLVNLNGLANGSMENESDNYLLANRPSLCRVSRNANLVDFCGLTQLVATAGYYTFVFETNGFFITRDDIVNGNCSE